MLAVTAVVLALGLKPISTPDADLTTASRVTLFSIDGRNYLCG